VNANRIKYNNNKIFEIMYNTGIEMIAKKRARDKAFGIRG
jgi:hypothetical protein